MPARSSAHRCRKTQNTSYSACVKARKITHPGSKSPVNKTNPGLWIKWPAAQLCPFEVDPWDLQGERTDSWIVLTVKTKEKPYDSVNKQSLTET